MDLFLEAEKPSETNESYVSAETKNAFSSTIRNIYFSLPFINRQGVYQSRQVTRNIPSASLDKAILLTNP